MSNQNAISPYVNFKALLNSENVQERFKQLLDKRAPDFLASLLSLVGADEKLMACSPQSIFTAAAKAAILRLPIAKELGFAYIVPFKGEATFIVGYKGLVQLAVRTGQYVAINAAEIYEGEELTVDRLTGTIKLNGRRTGDNVTAYVAYFKLRNGFEKFVSMDKPGVDRHARRYSKSYGNDRSAWTTNFDDMAKKTVLRQLLGKWGLLSIEMIDNDEIPADGDDPRLVVPSFAELPNVIEGEPLGEPEPMPEPEPAASLDEQIIMAAVEAQLTENEHSGKATLKMCKTNPATVEDGVKWFRFYRGWRDLGGDSKQAAKMANEGKQPA